MEKPGTLFNLRNYSSLNTNSSLASKPISVGGGWAYRERQLELKAILGVSKK